MSKFVVIGAEGMLGRTWVNLLKERDEPVRALSRCDLDISDRSSLERAIGNGEDWVINCAAWSLVDAAEEQESDAHQINGTAVGFLAERCRSAGVRLLHYSTDYVFDGKSAAPYPTDHKRAPINAYGRSKALGEKLLEESSSEHLMIRTSWLYAPWGNNFVLTMRKLARERKKLKVVSDQIGRPSSTRHVAAVSRQLVERDQRGTFHVTDGGQCTWFDLASLIVEFINPKCIVEPCSSDDFSRPAIRPEFSVLDLSKTEALLGEMPPWQTQVTSMLRGLQSK